MPLTSLPTRSALQRYSAKRMQKPINFYFTAPGAQSVSILGDFNDWQPNANPMRRQPDGIWTAQVALHHGHHQYQFLVDGQPVLDPRAQGIARNLRGERASVVAVS
jgi:1,4-alpha-glucan branching enzyme